MTVKENTQVRQYFWYKMTKKQTGIQKKIFAEFSCRKFLKLLSFLFPKGTKIAPNTAVPKINI